MEKWRVSRLVETDDVTGKKFEIGGGIVRMQIGAVNGSLHTIDVTPVPVEQMQEETWDSQFVRLQVADRVVWMEPEEVQVFLELLTLAHAASLRNFDTAHHS